jgi:hypothetical protein
MSPRTFALLLASVSAFALAGETPRPTSRPIQIHDFETLSCADAVRLADKPVLYRIALDSLAEEYNGRILIDCASPDAIHRTVRLMPVSEVPDVLTVRARARLRLRVIVLQGFRPEAVRRFSPGA